MIEIVEIFKTAQKDYIYHTNIKDIDVVYIKNIGHLCIKYNFNRHIQKILKLSLYDFNGVNRDDLVELNDYLSKQLEGRYEELYLNIFDLIFTGENDVR